MTARSFKLSIGARVVVLSINLVQVNAEPEIIDEVYHGKTLDSIIIDDSGFIHGNVIES